MMKNGTVKDEGSPQELIDRGVLSIRQSDHSGRSEDTDMEQQIELERINLKILLQKEFTKGQYTDWLSMLLVTFNWTLRQEASTKTKRSIQSISATYGKLNGNFSPKRVSDAHKLCLSKTRVYGKGLPVYQNTC